MGRLAWFALLGALVFTSPVQSEEGWIEPFVNGEYEEAARLARSHNTDESWAFAARATLAHAVAAPLSKTQAQAVYSRAEADARRALALNPSHVEASLNVAIALGHLARLHGPSLVAIDLAWIARRHIDAALAEAPQNPWAKALRGAWRMTVAHHAGPIIGPIVFGATWDEGKRDFLSALESAPDNILLQFHFADALRLKSAEQDLPLMREALRATTRRPAENSLERVIQKRAVARLWTQEPAQAAAVERASMAAMVKQSAPR